MNIQAPEPKVTVLLCTYNSARFLAEAIESILNQSHKDLRLAILDGGSSDPTLDIARAYAARDKRAIVQVHPNLLPRDRAAAFLPEVKSELIAAQHSDDISFTHRLACQIQAFAANRTIGVCGGWIRSFLHRRTESLEDPPLLYCPPEHHAEIKAQLPFWWVMNTQAIMFRREILQAAPFVNEYTFGNDYWHTIEIVDRFEHYNLPMEILSYRRHGASDSTVNNVGMLIEIRAIRERILRHFGFSFTPDQLRIHQAVTVDPFPLVDLKSKDDYLEFIGWMESMRQQNLDLKAFEPAPFAQFCNKLLQFANRRARHRGWTGYTSYMKYIRRIWREFTGQD